MGNCISPATDSCSIDTPIPIDLKDEKVNDDPKTKTVDRKNLNNTYSIPEYDVDQKPEKLLIFGYMRMCIKYYNQNYDDIFSIILLFYADGYAQHIIIKDHSKNNNFDPNMHNIISKTQFITGYSFIMDKNNNSNSNKQFKVKFGDVIQIGTQPLFIWGDNIRYTYYKHWVRVPYEICCKLDNAVRFYSQLMIDSFQSNSLSVWNLYLKHDDKYIINKFGGSLNKRYRNVVLQFKQNKLVEFGIQFNAIGKKTFNPSYWNYCSKDIDEFYRVRKDPYGKKVEVALVAIIIAIRIKIEYKEVHPIYFVSPCWEFKLGHSGWSRNHNYNHVVQFIGPENEKEKMIQQIKEKYQPYKILKLSVVDIANYSRYMQGDENKIFFVHNS